MENRTGDSEIIISHVILPQDTNPAGNVHGGVVARRHARSNTVTASIDRIDFHHPAYLGNLVTLKASLNFVGNASMEVGVRVETEDLLTGEIGHTASAYLTFVALDGKGRPQKVPPLKLETDEAVRRNREAKARRERRFSQKAKEEKCQKDLNSCEL